MKSENQIAFKEWAAVVNVLAEGRQILIVRKGGIREEGGQFQVEHNEFFLFPTFEHQKVEDLKPEARSYLQKAIAEKPNSNQIPIKYYTETKSIFQITDEQDIAWLDRFHIWSQKAMTQRFHFGKQKGLFVLAVRIYQLPEKLVPVLAEYGGCKSWGELQSNLGTQGAIPVLSDQTFSVQLQQISSLFPQAKIL